MAEILPHVLYTIHRGNKDDMNRPIMSKFPNIAWRLDDWNIMVLYINKYNNTGNSEVKPDKKRQSKILIDFFYVDLLLKWNPETYSNMNQLFTKAPLETLSMKKKEEEEFWTQKGTCVRLFIH